jgi:hypothetical protein
MPLRVVFIARVSMIRSPLIATTDGATLQTLATGELAC